MRCDPVFACGALKYSATSLGAPPDEASATNKKRGPGSAASRPAWRPGRDLQQRRTAMTWHNKVVWTEGMFLQPQHFQQHDRYTEYQLRQRLASTVGYPWGYTSIPL